MRSKLPPTVYLLARNVVGFVVARDAGDLAGRPIGETKEYLVRLALHFLTPHGTWESCQVPRGEMCEAVEALVAEALVDELARTVTP